MKKLTLLIALSVLFYSAPGYTSGKGDAAPKAAEALGAADLEAWRADLGKRVEKRKAEWEEYQREKRNAAAEEAALQAEYVAVDKDLAEKQAAWQTAWWEEKMIPRLKAMSEMAERAFSTGTLLPGDRDAMHAELVRTAKRDGIPEAEELVRAAAERVGTQTKAPADPA